MLALGFHQFSVLEADFKSTDILLKKPKNLQVIEENRCKKIKSNF